MNEAGKNYLNPFWQDFETILIGHGVSRDRVKWYLRWTRMFDRSLASRIEERSEQDVD
jgi:hypothetical protein